MSEDVQERGEELHLLSEAFNILVDLFSARKEPVEAVWAYRDGWLDAYCFLTGEGSEEVYERVQEAVIARHEVTVAEQD